MTPDMTEWDDLRARLATAQARIARYLPIVRDVAAMDCVEIVKDEFAGFETTRDCAARGVVECHVCRARRALAASPEKEASDG